MPKVQIQAWLELKPGDRLLYDCPLMSQEDHESDLFFRKYRYKIARFCGYLEECIGLNDRFGREPGRYVNPAAIRVVFEGETKEYALSFHHLVLLGPEDSGAEPERELKSQRLGPLPEEIAFLPLDVVCFANDLLQTERRVKEVSVESKTGAVTYKLRSTAEERRAHEDEIARLRKERPGSYSPLTHLPPVNEMEKYPRADLVFMRLGPLSLLGAGKPAEEIETALGDVYEPLDFWRIYLPKRRLGDKQRPTSVQDAIVLVEDGQAVFIDDHDGCLVSGGKPVIDLYQSDDSRYADHVRKLSLAYWRERLLKKEKRLQSA
jgi:hypothetical protein